MGFANLADAMEMMILSILAPALHCHWHITQVEQATITTVVFLGKKKNFKNPYKSIFTSCNLFHHVF
jgi:hypothetical protein